MARASALGRLYGYNFKSLHADSEISATKEAIENADNPDKLAEIFARVAARIAGITERIIETHVVHDIPATDEQTRRAVANTFRESVYEASKGTTNKGYNNAREDASALRKIQNLNVYQDYHDRAKEEILNSPNVPEVQKFAELVANPNRGFRQPETIHAKGEKVDKTWKR